MKTPAQQAPQGGNASRAGRVHFYVAAVVLAAAAGGFNAAKEKLGVVLVKKAVPPTAKVRTQEQRLVSFPEKIGPYRLVGDGEWERDKQGKPVKDGKPDGITVFRPEQLGEMDIANHPMNWYYAGVFVDGRSRPPKLFQISITYYTGTLDAIPHVPENCLRAGEAQVLAQDSGDVPVELPGTKDPWGRFVVRRIAYQESRNGEPVFDPIRGEPVKHGEYYVFSMNGKPTCSRAEMRLKLAWPLDKYSYYAKVQVAPLLGNATLAEQDEACREFLQAAMPVVLEYLPSAADVEALSRGSGS